MVAVCEAQQEGQKARRTEGGDRIRGVRVYGIREGELGGLGERGAAGGLKGGKG